MISRRNWFYVFLSGFFPEFRHCSFSGITSEEDSSMNSFFNFVGHSSYNSFGDSFREIFWDSLRDIIRYSVRNSSWDVFIDFFQYSFQDIFTDYSPDCIRDFSRILPIFSSILPNSKISSGISFRYSSRMIKKTAFKILSENTSKFFLFFPEISSVIFLGLLSWIPS